jgi:predicted aspartyl protease
MCQAFLSWDTGATFVVLTTGFSRKTHIDVDNDAHVRLTALNGVIEAKRGPARTIRLRTLVAKDGQVVVQSDDKPLLGPGFVGVLGMSLLSRFNVAMVRKQSEFGDERRNDFLAERTPVYR